jgi:TonB-dependent SusC/RagA subfamily outer membrane receptor
MRNTTTKSPGQTTTALVGPAVRRTLSGVALAGAALVAAAACASRAKPADPAPAPTGATVGDRDVQGQNAVRTQELFEGRFPGVQVYAQGGGVAVRVRGASTINGSTEPLFVLDGQPLAQGNGGVIDINPNDIARIEVLRSPTDLAMYGSRSGNGVVRITTKRGRKPSG